MKEEKTKKINLIIDGNLLARKSFYKFKNLSTEIKNKELKLVSKSLLKKDKENKKKIISDNSGRDISFNKEGKIEKKIKEISEREGSTIIYTGVLYGMLRSILVACKKFNISNIVIIYDPLPEISNQFRYKIADNYKNRKKDPETEANFYASLILAQSFFYRAGIKQVTTTKFEADDLLHYYSHKIYKDENVIALTNDHDLFQILVPNRVKILKIGSDYSLYTATDFKKEFSIKPKQYRDVLALGGCSTDNVKGVKGISKNTALSLIQKYGSIINLFENYKKESLEKRVITALEKEEENDLKNLKLSLKLVSLYGLNNSLKKDILTKKTTNSPEICYKQAIFLLKLLKFRSFLTESSKKSLKSIIFLK